MPKQLNDLLTKVRKSGFVPRPNSPFSPPRGNASHASRANRTPQKRLFTQTVFRIQLRLTPPDKRLETLESLFTPVFSEFTGNSLNLAI